MIIIPVKYKDQATFKGVFGKTIWRFASKYIIAQVCNELGIKEHTIEGLQQANGKMIYVEYKYTDDTCKCLCLAFAEIVINEDELERYKETGKFFIGFETYFVKDEFSRQIVE